jgi:hypothetical protein
MAQCIAALRSSLENDSDFTDIELDIRTDPLPARHIERKRNKNRTLFVEDEENGLIEFQGTSEFNQAIKNFKIKRKQENQLICPRNVYVNT